MAPDPGLVPVVEVDKKEEGEGRGGEGRGGEGRAGEGRGGEGRAVRAYTHNSFSETDFWDSVQCLFPRLDLASVHGGKCLYHLPTLA